MDAPAGTPLTPSYSCDSSAAAVAAAANPSAGSFGFAAAPPSTGVARGIFMPSGMTSVTGGLAPAPAVNPRAPLLQLSNVARAKKGKVSGKKKKAADDFGSSKPSRKRHTGRVTTAEAPEEAAWVASEHLRAALAAWVAMAWATWEAWMASEHLRAALAAWEAVALAAWEAWMASEHLRAALEACEV
ncbi:hypothetical protein D1007_60748 [Hordeum vulgare]|nr:hypothetical protein D1007_60748 [Hordeum vulgare]